MTAAPINLTPPETGVRDRPVVSSRPINPPFHSSYGPARPVPSTDVSRYPFKALKPDDQRAATRASAAADPLFGARPAGERSEFPLTTNKNPVS